MPLRVAVAGLGGYAGSHHTIFAELEATGAVKGAAASDPRLAEISPLCEQFDFASRHVRTWNRFDDMMAAHAAELDVAVIATPIHLHAEMHEACVNAGIACYLEKPPTLDPMCLNFSTGAWTAS